MPGSGHTFVLELFDESGSVICALPVAPDWEPALESARFAAIRRGTGPAVMAAPSGMIEPIWHPRVGAPYIAGVDVVPAGSVASRYEVPTGYFAELARAAGAALVERGHVRDGSRLPFLVRAVRVGEGSGAEGELTAAPPGESGAAADATDLALEEIVRPLPLVETELAPLLATAEASGVFPEDAAEDVPVLLPRPVRDQAMALAARAGEVEVGGFLIGRLHRDRGIPEVFVEITAQVAAEHTCAEATKLTFTPETWAAARRAMEARGGGELLVGWWHYHPDFCARCAPERRRQCTLASTFFSLEDVHLHRVCFSQAFAVALLVSATPAGLVPSLFGWRRGRVAARGYHLTGAAERAPVHHDQHDEGEDHAS